VAKAKQVYSWGDIPQKTFKEFEAAVEKLREEMIPRDCDGDSPIEVLIVNRMTYEPINYLAVPRNEVYSYITHGFLKVHPDVQQELDDETERGLTANVAMAANALERYMRLKQFHHRDAQEKKPTDRKGPEPRWCMNPECRCKLPEYHSKKGKKDMNICVNPRCGLDNTKHYPEAVPDV